jgi:hypothetical protein
MKDWKKERADQVQGWSVSLIKISNFPCGNSNHKPLARKLYYSLRKRKKEEGLLLYETAYNLPPASFLLLLNVIKIRCLVSQKRKKGCEKLI